MTGFYARLRQTRGDSDELAACIERVVNQGADAAGVRYFPSWAEALFENDEVPASPVPLPELPDGFRVLFAGNIGAAQDFPAVLAALKALADEGSIPLQKVSEAIAKYGIKTDKINPLYA